MINATRRIRKNFTPAQKLEYAKLMVEADYSNRQVIELSGAGPTAVSRWKRQYLAEQPGEVAEGKTALDSDKRRIQEVVPLIRTGCLGVIFPVNHAAIGDLMVS